MEIKKQIVKSRYDDLFFSPDFGTLPHYARLRAELKAAGTPIPANDCWISALALQHRMPLLSRDRHFDFVSGVRRIDW
jgi:predicted nucleic acid-binding protein